MNAPQLGWDAFNAKLSGIPHVPQITARAVDPTPGLMDAYHADDPEEFYRILAEKYPDEEIER